jgi:uncharacterized protein YjeT (DUF2065 family)
MQASIFLAQLLGPLLLLPGVGILINPRVFRTIAQEVVRSTTLLYLFGLIDFAAGLAIVLNHNVWAASWRVLIRLVGSKTTRESDPGLLRAADAPWAMARSG